MLITLIVLNWILAQFVWAHVELYLLPTEHRGGRREHLLRSLFISIVTWCLMSDIAFYLGEFTLIAVLLIFAVTWFVPFRLKFQ